MTCLHNEGFGEISLPSLLLNRINKLTSSQMENVPVQKLGRRDAATNSCSILLPHITRANYIAMHDKSYVTRSPDLPAIEQSGWRLDKECMCLYRALLYLPLVL